jgi:uncharacterized membrane protein YraQ (UPF0718 family)
MPFLAVGALLSGAIEVLVPPERLIKRVPKSLIGGLSLGIAAGVALPTCECGVVPIVRRLIRKGVPAHIAIAYMLAAPVLNPVVLASTYVAFRGSILMLLSRAVIAIIVAATVGVIVSRMGGALRKGVATGTGSGDGHGHIDQDHDSDDSGECSRASHDHASANDLRPPRARLLTVIWDILRHAAHDFLDMGKYLIVGALAAAFFKTFLPQAAFDMLSENLVLSIGGMMLLAFLLSVCSEADAFVAASFAGLPAASHLAFVNYGPTLDLKLIGMYAGTFKRQVFLTLLVVPTVMVFVLTLIHGLVF